MSQTCIGLTGGIASGKSALERAFLARGIVVADADRIARAVVEPGTPALAAIVAHFGAEVLDAQAGLDRAAMRRRVFEDENARQSLEAIVHPAVRAALEAQCRAAASPYAVAMIPLLAEGGGRERYPWLQRICVVTAPLEVRMARLLARDGIDQALAQRMIQAQASDAQRLAIADDIVRNDGSLEEIDQAVAELDARYRLLAGA
ncbi:dephospho-CoA kinase [Pseudoxanthomonas winnipegensis]|uniref:Dephospho-CoA kinase n=1 Tax=Pseudoxanthomonas winnipegensis TaxID=2480810 RepID=A0A4Q8LU42_9GAMM|nr:dephospho-CoA kinase [Pseudoxanthomonas winnipegensis]RZZ82024.1 dephospho-CoA kinase [Pseudoxanthomonas winnipegensis]TAA35507.1 dephospho-CoA kinase [Pseudoxanthomonas winnipegensis]